jgi:hypothetical protein
VTPEAAFSEATAFVQYSFVSTLGHAFGFLLFEMDENRGLCHSSFKRDRERGILVSTKQLIVFSTTPNSQQLFHSSQLKTVFPLLTTQPSRP